MIGIEDGLVMIFAYKNGNRQSKRSFQFECEQLSKVCDIDRCLMPLYYDLVDLGFNSLDSLSPFVMRCVFTAINSMSQGQRQRHFTVGHRFSLHIE